MVVALGMAFQVFSVPHAQVHVLLKVERSGKVGEDKLLGMKLVNPWYDIPQTALVDNGLLLGKDQMVHSVGYNHIQNVTLSPYAYPETAPSTETPIGIPAFDKSLPVD